MHKIVTHKVFFLFFCGINIHNLLFDFWEISFPQCKLEYKEDIFFFLADLLNKDFSEFFIKSFLWNAKTTKKKTRENRLPDFFRKNCWIEIFATYRCTELRNCVGFFANEYVSIIIIIIYTLV